MIYVYGQDLRDGIRLIRRTTDKPIGMNVLIERSSKFYLERMRRYVDIAIDEGVRFFVTSLGNPRWPWSEARAPSWIRPRTAY